MNGTPQPHQFWGKSQPRGTPTEWHPLIDHCVDVAACGKALLQLPNIRRSLACLAGRDTLDDVTIDRLSVLIGFHDLGKFNHGFQNRIFNHASLNLTPKAGHLSEILNLLEGERYRQSEAIFKIIDDPFLTCWGGKQLLMCSICHHGEPIEPTSIPEPRYWEPNKIRDIPTEIQKLVDTMRQMFPLAWNEGELLPPETRTGFEHAFVGIVILSDWLGSNTLHFPYSFPGQDRVIFALEEAKQLVQRMFMDPTSQREALVNVHTFFDCTGIEPRPAQEVLFATPVPTESSITILEAETGSGKTEAAFARYVQLFKAGLVDSMYFALPTRSAATQIHERLRRLAQRLWGKNLAPPVILAIPGYMKVDEETPTLQFRDENGLSLTHPRHLWGDKDPASTWAAEKTKQCMAGAIVVGTIDQVLLSTLQVSHAHLRAALLLRGFLVVDEVHASDCFQNRLLEEVLKHHQEGGGHSLLMSATLGSPSRESFLRKEPGTEEMPKPTLEETRKWSYPHILQQQGFSDPESYPVPQGADQKSVFIEPMSWIGNPEKVAQKALEAAKAGACVLVIRNTVTDCVQTQKALEELAGTDTSLLFKANGVITPHHSRYAPADRKILDTALEETFRARKPFVVVATQTVQQSLDIDADLLITDLCPTDVLLQRIGRLHRHKQDERPSAFRSPRCILLVPERRDLSSSIGKSGKAFGQHGLGTVYRDLKVLTLTWKLAEDKEVWTIPEENRELVERTFHTNVPFSPWCNLDRWQKHADHIRAHMTESKNIAGFILIDWEKTFLTAYADDGIKVAARLTDPESATIQISWQGKVKSPFGADIKELPVIWRLLKEEDQKPPQTVTKAVSENLNGGVEVSVHLTTTCIRYTRLGVDTCRISEEEVEKA